MKKSILLSTLLLPLAFLMGCNNQTITVKDMAISHELEFGGIYIHKAIEDFNHLGFAYGDSVDITFTNGYKVKDLPYYNGYYVDAGQALLVGYPGYDYIKLTLNYGDDLWYAADFSEDTKATISLNKKEKYKGIQEASDISYYDERERYETNVEFANFRNMKVGNLAEGVLYRSASPCDNKHNRASYVDRLMEEAGVQFVLNLADTKEKIDGYIAKEDFNSPYFLSLYQKQQFFLATPINDKVEPLALNMNYMSDEFREKVASGINYMANSTGPYLVHCLEGKDRTGFVCILLESLMNATYQEIVDDYMLTYDNYYKIKVGDPKYDIIKNRNVDSMLNFICEGNDYRSGSTSNYAKQYLIKGGMSEEAVNALINKLSTPLN